MNKTDVEMELAVRRKELRWKKEEGFLLQAQLDSLLPHLAVVQQRINELHVAIAAVASIKQAIEARIVALSKGA